MFKNFIIGFTNCVRYSIGVKMYPGSGGSNCNLVPRNVGLSAGTDGGMSGTHVVLLWVRTVRENVGVLGRLLARQCEFVAAHRLRRAYQVWCLHTRLYSDASFNKVLTKLGRKFIDKQRPLCVLLGTVLFSWEKNKITDDDLRSVILDLAEVQKLLAKGADVTNKNCQTLTSASCQESWNLVINREHLKVLRKAVPNSVLFEYKVFGSFYDIPARAFFNVQVDTEYRKKWDKLVIKLDLIERDERSNCEVLHWVMHYPYPMSSRDYVYIRRHKVDDKKKVMVLISRSTEHPSAPVTAKYVRVATYRSSMVIQPHAKFDEKGFDYVLTYFDNPQAVIPSAAYNWMASSGVPDFVEKLHNAAVSLHDEEEKKKILPTPRVEEPTAKKVKPCKPIGSKMDSSSSLPLYT